jgi:hypothetical protein
MTEWNKKYANVLSSPLDTLICVERSDDMAGAMTDDQKRLETLFNGFQERFSGFQSEVITNITNIKEDIGDLNDVISKLTQVVNETYAKVTNGLTDTVNRHEQMLQEKVDRREFNNAMDSIRAEMKQTRRLMWGFFTLMVGMIGSVIGLIVLI